MQPRDLEGVAKEDVESQKSNSVGSNKTNFFSKFQNEYSIENSGNSRKSSVQSNKKSLQKKSIENSPMNSMKKDYRDITTMNMSSPGNKWQNSGVTSNSFQIKQSKKDKQTFSINISKPLEKSEQINTSKFEQKKRMNFSMNFGAKLNIIPPIKEINQTQLRTNNKNISIESSKNKKQKYRSYDLFNMNSKSSDRNSLLISQSNQIKESSHNSIKQS